MAVLCNKSKFVAFLAVMSFYVVVYITTHMSHVTYMWVNTYHSTSTNYATYANPPPPLLCVCWNGMIVAYYVYQIIT